MQNIILPCLLMVKVTIKGLSLYLYFLLHMAFTPRIEKVHHSHSAACDLMSFRMPACLVLVQPSISETLFTGK